MPHRVRLPDALEMLRLLLVATILLPLVLGALAAYLSYLKNDQAATQSLGIDGLDQIERDQLAVILVAMGAGYDQERRSPDAGNRHDWDTDLLGWAIAALG